METTDGKNLVDGAWYWVTPPNDLPSKLASGMRPRQYQAPDGPHNQGATLRGGSHDAISERWFDSCIIKGPIPGPALAELMWDQICIAAIGGKLQPETLKVIIELGKKEGFS